MLQASRTDGGAFARVQSLTEHSAFDWSNPNRVRALIGQFAAENPVVLHQEDSAGYRFLADSVIKLNSVNPQVAARLVMVPKHRPGINRNGGLPAEAGRRNSFR